ncbi:RBPJ-interacting and tubulin-associated protein 1-like [Acanthaster planci]|uniref:RBPJ-interacting and tubulin-associated protein 1 n=1 Tax=Acanthaster planci TaxID=133434 RepID=A0A8B7YHD7_ACAPL|nr:RBPJ-interacting and tubulin-associated protein 1-like [Acanthaster planci]XP_022091051.1 RBPJ-interacting and tubulin-associated protein 1-like [Acanthaster planci]XP_022091052.1 RBPJ-interacting and tubulin-associated protein 1-like [Acanthaster planci]XP_022091053.1 RBPJ-interacting and tubulin-associated protein 1-like [Acanthaster planci]
MTSFSSRPDSGRATSLSVAGETMHTNTPLHKTNKSYKYRKVSNSGSAEETLFTSQRERYLQSRNSPLNARPRSVGGSEWMVHGERNEMPSELPKRSPSGTPPIKPPLVSASGAPRTRSRLYKSSPSYIDESLFGPKLQEPDFPAPWEKPEDLRRGPLLTWSPPVPGSLCCTPRSTPPSRPPSAAGVGSRPGSATGDRRKGSQPPMPKKPVWK